MAGGLLLCAIVFTNTSSHHEILNRRRTPPFLPISGFFLAILATIMGRTNKLAV